MSNYYTQSQQPSASGPITFSSWSEKEEGVDMSNSDIDNKKESNVVDPNSTKLYREHFRTARDNAVPVFSGAAPSSSASIPSSLPPSTNQSWLQQYWYVLVIIFFVLVCVVVFGMYYKNLQKAHSSHGLKTTHAHTQESFQPSLNNFGSSGISNASGLLQDLEFL